MTDMIRKRLLMEFWDKFGGWPYRPRYQVNCFNSERMEALQAMARVVITQRKVNQCHLTIHPYTRPVL